MFTEKFGACSKIKNSKPYTSKVEMSPQIFKIVM